MKCELVPATKEHAEHIAAHVRDPDRVELWITSMSKPERVMLSGMRLSDFCLTGMADGEPVCMWGVVRESLIGNVGVPWMVGSKSLDRLANTFLRRCRGPLMQALGDYDRLVNYVDSRNDRTIRWLKWLGFRFDPHPMPYGVFNMPFYRFEMLKGG